MKSHYWHFQKSAPTWTEHVPASPQNVIESFIRESLIKTGFNSVIIQGVLIVKSDIFRNCTYVTLRSTRVWLTQTVLGWEIITSPTGSIHGGNLWILIVDWKAKSGYLLCWITDYIRFGILVEIQNSFLGDANGEKQNQYMWILVDLPTSRSLCLTWLRFPSLCSDPGIP